MYDYSGLSFQHIQYFITIAEMGMMSKASEVLHVSPSLLSQKVSQMENLIGIELFHRTRRRLFLTAAGKQLLVDLKDIQLQLYHVLDSAREQHCASHSLIIGFSNYQDHNSADHFLQHFKKCYPDLDYAVEIQPRKQLQMDFLDRKIDILAMVDYEKLRQDRAVVSRIARMITVGCYVNASMPIAQGEALSWKQLDGATCILPEHSRNSALTRDLKRKFNEENIAVSMQFHNGDMMTVNQLVTLNNYITFAMYRPTNSDNLKSYRMPGLEYPYMVAYHTDADAEVAGYAEALYNIICRYYHERS